MTHLHPPAPSPDIRLVAVDLDGSLLDFEMLQTGHDDLASVPYTVSLVRGSRLAKPPMPTIDGEVCYEGILGHCRDDLQRYLIWRCLLCGTAGHSYGANGIWQINRPGQPYGNSPAGNNWGNTSWQEATALPGSRQMGVARRFFESHDWWKFESHPEWVDYASPAPEIAWGQWIWVPGEDATRHAPVGRRYFRRTFNTPGQPVVRAFLRVAADDNVQVFLNGRVVGEQVGWTPYREFEVSRFLLPGTNLISAVVGNVRTASPTNAAGLLCNLSLTFSGGTGLEIPSDENWRCSPNETPGWSEAVFDDREWPTAVPVAAPGAGPWGKVTSPDTLLMPDAAGLPGELRIILLPTDRDFRVDKLEPGVRYAASFLNPQTGESQPLAAVAEGDAKNSWLVPQRPPGSKDWVLLLEAR